MIDCQTYTEHLEKMGARLIPRDEFLSLLTKNVSLDSNFRSSQQNLSC
jgi:leucyl/phenylalanyl-tRNA--protein transferase